MTFVREPDADFAAAIGGRPLTGTRPLTLLGLEHEYRLRRHGSPLDFRHLIHDLPIEGRRVDPGDANCYRCRSGIALTCDDAEAEVATPPIEVKRDFASTLDGWAARARAELQAALPADVEADGFSTHLSLAMSDELNDAVCSFFAQDFAAAFMLFTDRSDSYGIYVRPRPGRMEICGEFVSGRQLRLAATFLLGAARASMAAVTAPGRLPLPPRLAPRMYGSDDRFGFYVDRRALASDFYTRPREATLPLREGGTIRTQDYLLQAWASARATLGSDAAPEDVRALDAIVAGQQPLSVEASWLAEPIGQPAANGAVRSSFGDAIATRRLGSLELSPHLVTWDFVVFRVRAVGSEGRSAYASIPREQLRQFLDRVDRGLFHGVFARYLGQQPRGRHLAGRVDAMRSGLFDSVGAARAMMPLERPPEQSMQVRSDGTIVPTSTQLENLERRERIGKFERPERPGKYVSTFSSRISEAVVDPARSGATASQAGPTPGTRGRNPLLIVVGVVVALLVIAAGILLLGGGEDDGDPVGSVDQTTTPTSTPTTPAVVTTVPADPTESPTATETQIAAAPPEVGPITALLLAPITSYTVEASSPAGLELSYRWSLVADPGQDCGRKLPSGFGTSTVDLSTVQWSHANEAPDGCHHDAPDHPFTIEVEVSDGVNPPILRTYRGSNSGVGPVP